MAGNKRKPAAPSTKQAKDASRASAEALRSFVRARATDYLADPNVTSVGIGYKVVDGKPTDTVAVQFTVRRKVAPEALESLGTSLLPESVEVDGVAVPTDVLERSYEASYRIVAEPEAAPAEAKARLDPIRPGISVGNVKVSAGTIGAIVYDRTDGTPLVLSNWHVLNGPDGKIGDTVVQPGAYDDDRVDDNRLGALYRSHLGAAGDCAVATIEDRGYAPEPLGLTVAPTELGEPELGDKVIKSGRTTGVTHGLVRRIDVVVKIDYGGSVGEQQIGGFEIGPDPRNPAPDNQISEGGDSGAVWLFKAANGRPTGVFAGLHFGGEAAGSPDDHALACLGKSVFTKLGITLTPPDGAPAAQAAGAARIGAGYDPDFLGAAVPVPGVDASVADDAVEVDGSPIIDYTHFSLTQSRSRRLTRWVAWNIDGTTLKNIERSGSKFVLDPRLPADTQVGNELYSGNRIDRGHVARRADLTWGSTAEAEQANTDSFYYTNISPQVEDFNQSARQGIWGLIENAVLTDAEAENLKVSVFGGPVFGDDDRTYRGVALPREFFKVVAFVSDGKLVARGFLLTQNLDRLEALDLDEFRAYQVSLATIEERTKLRFADDLHGGDTYNAPESLAEHQPLASVGDIAW
ncbi:MULTISPECIES: DNA/RNA non-specific endonuclease [Tsukamurella]|uniref:DNA/RNA non-specific endonuclease n=2 Tax=Tsukamurella TaxID=2060 RepID=A0A5C5RXE3_9ACTN|nr:MULTISPECIES: DNA/RNA non-specific endonuclease [Tsukamurella]NMD57354.1 DNA/RNA non-specific endonuclease [Tsukamurella columbiensis]TWS27747.1 DNA/RNA non-specific endonuclease [Tsukamurella conjunctivitidis]